LVSKRAIIVSERELMFTFAAVARPSVVCLSGFRPTGSTTAALVSSS